MTTNSENLAKNTKISVLQQLFFILSHMHHKAHSSISLTESLPLFLAKIQNNFVILTMTMPFVSSGIFYHSTWTPTAKKQIISTHEHYMFRNSYQTFKRNIYWIGWSTKKNKFWRIWRKCCVIVPRVRLKKNKLLVRIMPFLFVC